MKKYFPRIFGNSETCSRIGAAIENRTVPHAFLLLGPSGSGKHTMATEIAAALNCTSGGASLPCGECSLCKRIYEGNFTDVKLLEKPKDKATLGVGPIKEFREDMFLSATESDFKVYIIADAEYMTIEAQNALLKVLEEPPSGVIIILLSTEGDKILSTIKSRAQTVNMARFHHGELKRILLEISREARELERESKELLDSLIMSSDGRIGEALRLTDKRSSEALEEERADTLRIARALRHGAPFTELYSALSSLPQKRPELLSALELSLVAIRDLIAIGAHSEVGLLFFTERSECETLAGQIGVKRLYEAYEAICEAHKYCSQNANTTNIIAALTARLRYA